MGMHTAFLAAEIAGYQEIAVFPRRPQTSPVRVMIFAAVYFLRGGGSCSGMAVIRVIRLSSAGMAAGPAENVMTGTSSTSHQPAPQETTTQGATANDCSRPQRAQAAGSPSRELDTRHGATSDTSHGEGDTSFVSLFEINGDRIWSWICYVAEVVQR